jgi:cytochrome c5
MRVRRFAVAALTLLLLACGQQSTPAGNAAPTAPSDPKLARLYAQTCKACHTSGASGAPRAGDRAAWQPRLAQGMNVLVEHAVNGYKGMPPMGSCMDCSEGDFEALIQFMSGG